MSTPQRNATWKWDQCREALTDIRVWLYVCVVVRNFDQLKQICRVVLTLFLSQSGGSITTNFASYMQLAYRPSLTSLSL